MLFSNKSKIISFNITKLPKKLLIPKGDNSAKFQLTNHSDKSEIFRLIFQGENLEVRSTPTNLKKGINFNAGETRKIELTLNPTIDGIGKLNLIIYWMKESESKVKVQKVKEQVTPTRLKEILNKYVLDTIFSPSAFNLSDYIASLTSQEIQKEEVESMDLDALLKLIEDTPESDKKQEIITNLAFDKASINPELAFKIIQMHQDTQLKEKLLVDVIMRTLSLDQPSAQKLTNDIPDDDLKVKILFNIAKKLVEVNKKSDSVEIFNQIIDTVINSSQINTSAENYENSEYKILIDAISCLAEIENPKTADALIGELKDRELKEKIALNLFDTIYEMVDEIIKTHEPAMVYSQYFLFNSYVSNINDDVRTFSKNGGNVSKNIILKEVDFDNLFVSLFSLDFSVFPIIDRVYSDLKYNSNKSIGYFIYPSKVDQCEKEFTIIKNTLEHFLVSNNSKDSDQFFVYNLDFVPYLGKPTVIISSESKIFEDMKLKIENLLENSANILYDDNIFKEGETMELLKQVFREESYIIVNLILSYEFIKDYEILERLINSLF